ALPDENCLHHHGAEMKCPRLPPVRPSVLPPTTPTSAILGHTSNTARCSGLLSKHLIEPLPIPIRSPRTNHATPPRAPVIRHIIYLIAPYRCVSNSLDGLGRDLIRRSRVKCIIRS
ncbi:hypothetical protein PIB30_113635, partial [Stylosanthes scabra]|nr:hypothetical protein [Stylosanthes scabra]